MSCVVHLRLLPQFKTCKTRLYFIIHLDLITELKMRILSFSHDSTCVLVFSKKVCSSSFCSSFFFSSSFFFNLTHNTGTFLSYPSACSSSDSTLLLCILNSLWWLGFVAICCVPRGISDYTLCKHTFCNH